MSQLYSIIPFILLHQYYTIYFVAFQLEPGAIPHSVIVISPLISLMADQKEAISAQGLTAFVIGERKNMIQDEVCSIIILLLIAYFTKLL